MKLTDEMKEEVGKYFNEGIHKVKITAVTDGTTASDKYYFEFELRGDAGEEGTARIFWSEKAAKYSFNTLRSLFVHNVADAKKDEMRAKITAISDTDKLLEIAQRGLVGKEAWYVVERSNNTYQNAQGETKYSYNRNIFGYEPQPKKITADDLIQDFKNATPVSTDELPFD